MSNGLTLVRQTTSSNIDKVVMESLQQEAHTDKLYPEGCFKKSLQPYPPGQQWRNIHASATNHCRSLISPQKFVKLDIVMSDTAMYSWLVMTVSPSTNWSSSSCCHVSLYQAATLLEYFTTKDCYSLKISPGAYLSPSKRHWRVTMKRTHQMCGSQGGHFSWKYTRDVRMGIIE